MSQINTGAYRVGPVRLDELNRVPTLTEIQHLLDIAEESHVTAQLPWRCGNSHLHYAVSVVVSKNPSDAMPRWAFYKDIGPDFKVDWAYATPDVSLIHNMLLCTFSDEVLTPEMHASYAYMPAVPGASSSGSSAAYSSSESHSSGSPPSENRLPSRLPEPAREPERRCVLHGSLQNMAGEELLQSLGSSRLTGKIVLTFHDLQGEIFLENGVPVHSTFSGLSGEDAAIELLTWHAGEFEVFSGETSTFKTIRRRAIALVMASALLRDNEEVLNQANINAQSILSKNVVGAVDVVQQLRDGIVVDPAMQKAVLELIDDQHSIAEIVKRLHLSKAQWVPLIVNLFQSGMVRARTIQSKLERADEVPIDNYPLQALKQTLIVPGSGLYSSGMFLFFLEQEFQRFYDHHRPFSLVMISLKRDRAEPINPADLVQRMSRLSTNLRPSDRFCHFQSSSFGIVLPETTEVEAKAIVRNIVNHLTKETSENAGARGSFWMKIGSASVPVDCDSVGSLVSLALKQDHSSVFMLK